MQKSVGTAGSPDEGLHQGPPDAPHTRPLLLATNSDTKVLTQITDQQTEQNLTFC